LSPSAAFAGLALPVMAAGSVVRTLLARPFCLVGFCESRVIPIGE
jgi:hypothetical protein